MACPLLYVPLPRVPYPPAMPASPCLPTAASEFSVPRCPLGNHLRKKMCGDITNVEGETKEPVLETSSAREWLWGTNGLLLTDVENSFLVAHMGR